MNKFLVRCSMLCVMCFLANTKTYAQKIEGNNGLQNLPKCRWVIKQLHMEMMLVFSTNKNEKASYETNFAAIVKKENQ